MPTRGYDPDQDVLLDSRNLKGLAHPLRVRLLGLLREHGSSTATALGRRIGQSSGVTSYHLRQLAEYGFVEQDTERGNGRERWWRARHRSTHFEPYLVVGSDETTALAGEGYLRAVAAAQAERMQRLVDLTPTFVETFGEDWTTGSTISDALLWLTAAQAQALVEDLTEVVERYQESASGPGAGRRRVAVQYQVLPQPDEADDSPPVGPDATSRQARSLETPATDV